MPKNGFYFDATVRAKPIEDEKTLNLDDNLEEHTLYTDETLRKIEHDIHELFNNTDYAIIGGGLNTGLGDIALMPGTMLREPKGVRDIEDWYMSPIIRPQYVKELFDRQTEIAVENLKLYYEAVGNRISVIVICGADFGSQQSQMLSNDIFSDLYLPYYQKMNNWIHENTDWKTFKHCCGAVEPLIPYFIEAGFDVLNPVQISAAGMEPKNLKQKYGEKITFWGGGVNTQSTLPNGTPESVKEEVKRLVSIFDKDGGFIFNTIHNVQANVPVKNFLAMIEALND
jgi:uroporphyrinogen-III decarboxylase